MATGVPYDSDAGRAFCAAVTALMTGVSYRVSALMARELGPFPGYADSQCPRLRVLRNHRRAAWSETEGYEYLHTPPSRSTPRAARRPSWSGPRVAWDDAVAMAEAHGLRNAQVTVIAPTGTIGLVMDCDTTGIEPDFAFVKFKLVAAATSRSSTAWCPRPCARWATAAEIEAVTAYAVGRGTLRAMRRGQPRGVTRQGFTDEVLTKVEVALPTAFDVKYVSIGSPLARHSVNVLGLTEAQLDDPGFEILRHLGFRRRPSRPPTSTVAER